MSGDDGGSTGEASTFRLRTDGLALAVLTALILALYADVLFGNNILFGRDLAFYHYGMKKAVRELMLGGHFPWWNRLVGAGQPIAANPAYEVFYPLQLLVLLPGFLFGFQLHIVVHIVLAAAAVYLLLRQMRIGAVAAFLGAASVSLGGMVTSFAQLLPFLFSFTWMLWVFLFAARWLESRRVRLLVFAALAMSMQVILGEPVTLLQTIAVLIVAGAWHGARNGGRAAVLRNLTAAGGAIGLSLLFGAVQLLPALDFARDTVRSLGLGYRMVAAWSMPLPRPLELLFPEWAGRIANDGEAYFGGPRLYGAPGIPYVYSFYVGLLLAVSAAAGFIRRVRGWSVAAVVFGLSFVVAIGAHTPLLRILYDLHLASSFRYPEKFFVIGVLAIAIFGSVVLQQLFDGDGRLRRTALGFAAIVAGVAAAAWILTFFPAYPRAFARTWGIADPRRVELFSGVARAGWLTAFARAAALAGLLALWRRMTTRHLVGALLALLLVDVVPIAQKTVTRVSRDMLDPPPLTRQLPPPGTFRLFNQAALERVTFARVKLTREQQYWTARNGLYPLLSEYFGYASVNEYDTDATNLVNVRVFDELSRRAMLAGSPSWPDLYMRMANARVRLEAIDEPGAFSRAPSWDSAAVVRPVACPPSQRYSFASRLVGIRSPLELDSIASTSAVPDGVAFVPWRSGTAAPGVVLRAFEAPDETLLDVTASGPAFLVASVTNDRYWKAAIDGRPVRVVPTNIAFQGIAVPPGRHTIVFHYRNPLVRVGAIVSIASLLGALALIVLNERSGR